MKLLTIFGTRPEAIKMAPILHQIKLDGNFDQTICVTGQHKEMLEQVLSLFEIVPDINLAVMKKKQTLSNLTSELLTGIDEIIKKQKPRIESKWVMLLKFLIFLSYK